MKTILLLLLLIAGASLVHAQYTVTKVKGRIKYGQGGYVKPGSSLNATDVLVFSSKNDKLWVIMPGGGEKTISPSAAAAGTTAGLRQTANEADWADAGAVSLRAGAAIIEKLPAAISVEDGPAGRLVIEDENKFLFDAAVYPQDGNGEFFLQINAVSAQPLKRKLRVTGDTLVIYYEDFLTATSSAGNRYLLGYHKSNSPTSIRVADIRPYFDLTNEMEDIIASTVNTYKKENMPQDSLQQKAYANVYRMSGKPNGILFLALFAKYWAGNAEDTIKTEPKGKGNKTDDADTSAIPTLSELISTNRDALPASFTLRQYAPPVGDQSSYSTCAAWSSAYAARTISYAISHNYTYLEDSAMIKKNTFSPSFVYNNLVGGNRCDDGLSLRTALKFISDSGVINTKTQFRCREIYMKADIDNAKNYRLKGYQNVNDKKLAEDMLVGRVKDLIAGRHPVVYGMVTPHSFDLVSKSGIWQPWDDEYKNIDSVSKKLAPLHDMHAMCIVGYDDSVAGGSFEVMNSWGQLVARKGFYWVNYHDFYLFAREMYTISDFLPSKDSVVDAGKKKEVIVQNIATPIVKPGNEVIVKPPTLQAANTIMDSTAIAAGKPRLKGDMQFLYLKRDDTSEPIKLTVQYGSAGQSSAVAGNYPWYSFNKRMFREDQYSIKLSLSQDAYVYIMGVDKNGPYPLFPRDTVKNESPLVNFTNATLALPGNGQYFTIDSIAGREEMCVLLSKSPINTQALYAGYAANTSRSYATVMRNLQGRSVTVSSMRNTTADKIDFDLEATDNNILAFFIDIPHL